MRSRLCLTLALLAPLACGGDDGVSLSTVCDADNGLFIELIDKTIECNQEFFDLVFAPVAHADLSAACRAQFEGPLADGYLTFGSTEDAAACRRAIANTDCNAFDIDLVDECQNVLVGSQAAGEGCEVDLQCEGNAFCDRPDDNSCGVCVTRKPDGASCMDEDECEGRQCIGGLCTAPGEAGSNCEDDEECLGRLVCNHLSSTCQRIEDWSAGDSCMQDTSDCASLATGLYCRAGECTAFLAVGDTCGAAVGACNVYRGETCDMATMKCVAPTIVSEGEACNILTGTLCSDGLVCDPFPNGTCTAPAAVGDACDEMDGNPCPGTLLLDCVDGACAYTDYRGECPAE